MLVAAVGAILALALFHLGAVTGAVIEASVLSSAVSRSSAGVVSLRAESIPSPKQVEPTPSAGSPPS